MKGWKLPILLILVFLSGFFIIISVHYKDEITRAGKIQSPASILISDAPRTVTVRTEPAVREPKDYIIPSDEDLLQMSDPALMQIYWKYINMLQTLCKDVVRIGSMKDGGKEICIDEPYKPTEPCVVYSFGINNQFDFDTDIVYRFNCEVHCFDPSMNRSTGRINDKMWFYNYGLGGRNEVTEKGWDLKTLDTIRVELGHIQRPIDILKIDIEGDEWNAIPQMVTSGALDDVKQISMETHFGPPRPGSGPNWGLRTCKEQLSCLRLLYDSGFRIFMRERNMWSHFQWPGVRGFTTGVNEISLVQPPG